MSTVLLAIGVYAGVGLCFPPIAVVLTRFLFRWQYRKDHGTEMPPITKIEAHHLALRVVVNSILWPLFLFAAFAKIISLLLSDLGPVLDRFVFRVMNAENARRSADKE